MSSRTLALPLVALLTLGLTGCSLGNTTGPLTVTTFAPEPVWEDNCGFELRVETPPQRIVSIKSSATELLLALGVGDRIVGTAFSDGPVPEEWAAAAEGIPVISEFAPSQEAVLALEPDFVFGGWESNFTPDTAGDRHALLDLGVNSYVAPSACKGSTQLEELNYAHLFYEITEAGRVFGAQDAASRLVQVQRPQMEAIRADQRHPSALWYSSGKATPYVGAGIGAPDMIMETIGLENIAGDIADTWSSLSWEAVADANPDVIVLVDASWNTAESKIAVLEANPVTAKLDAVKNSRYLRIPFAASEAGVRTVPAAADLAEQLAKLELP